MPTKQDVKIVKNCLPGVLNAQTNKSGKRIDATLGLLYFTLFFITVSGDRLSGRPARSRIPNIHFEDVTVRSDYALVTDQDDLAFAELVVCFDPVLCILD